MTRNSNHAIGIDLGGTFIKAGLFSGRMDLLESLTVPTHDRTFDAVVTQLSHIIQDLQSKSPHPVGTIGIGVPGGVLQDQATVHRAPNFPGWTDLDLAKALSLKGIEDVVIENDANCAALAENQLGAAMGFNASVLFTLGTGVGGGVILNNRIYRGEWGMAGELGHMPVFPQGRPCGCGGRGCLEQYVSATAILQEADKCWNNGKLSGYSQPATAQAVYNLAMEGNRTCLDLFRKAGAALGIAVSGLINILNIPVFLIGGGAGASFELLQPQIRKEVERRVFPLAAQRVEIRRAKLGNNAGMTGAALLGTRV